MNESELPMFELKDPPVEGPGCAVPTVAEVIDAQPFQHRVRVRLDNPSQADTCWASLALTSSDQVLSGDRVLVIGDDRGDYFVIGVMTPHQAPLHGRHRVSLANGAHARVAGSGNSETLQVFNNDRELLFEYDPNGGTARVNIPHGDLEVSTPNGAISFRAKDSVSLTSEQSIDLSSPGRIRLLAVDRVGRIVSSLMVCTQRVKLTSAGFELIAKAGDVCIDRTRYIGAKLLTRVQRARLITHRLETVADTVVNQARNLYRTVRGLAQFHAGRAKTRVETTYHFRAQRSYLKAQEDFKVKAEKIHLG